MSNVLERLFSLKGKVALITGAGGGIGRALSIGFAEAGAQVALNGVKPEKLAETARLIEGIAGRGALFPRDLQNVEVCRQLIADCQKEMGRLDILVNCAGINRRKPIRDVTEEDYDAITNINLKSLFFLSQAAYPLMRSQGGGKIINIGSLTTLTGLAGISVYGAAKAGVGQLTRTMALEWAPDNIQVNCIAPGFIHTPLTEAGLWSDPHRKKWLLERIPLARGGQPDELVGTALLLAANASSYLTGQTIAVDGGFLAGGSWLRPDE